LDGASLVSPAAGQAQNGSCRVSLIHVTAGKFDELTRRVKRH